MWKRVVYSNCVHVCAHERSASQYLSALPRPQTSHSAQQTVKLSNATWIFCLHLLPPFSFFLPPPPPLSFFLMLTRFLLISLSIDNNIIGAEMFQWVWWLVPPPPPALTPMEEQDYLLLSISLFAHTIKSFLPVWVVDFKTSACFIVRTVSSTLCLLSALCFIIHTHNTGCCFPADHCCISCPELKLNDLKLLFFLFFIFQVSYSWRMSELNVCNFLPTALVFYTKLRFADSSLLCL